MKLKSDTLDSLVESGAIKSYSWRKVPEPESGLMGVAKVSTHCLRLDFENGKSVFINPTVHSEFGLVDVETGLHIEE